MATLYELASQIANFELEIDEETGEVLNADQLENIEMERNAKIENICLWIKNLKSDVAAYKAEKDSFEKKRKAAENKAEALKKYVQFVLAGEKFKTGRVSVSYRKSEAVECADVCKVPDDYLRYKDPELDKTKAKEALKAGIEIEGCKLVEKQNMQIR